jgi:hypothetical protein
MHFFQPNLMQLLLELATAAAAAVAAAMCSAAAELKETVLPANGGFQGCSNKA